MSKALRIRRLCSKCENVTDFESTPREETIIVKREPIRINIQYYTCRHCGDEVLDPASSPDPFGLAYEEYRERHGFLKPSEISSWRERFHLTQEEVSKLLGIGTATLSRYENGSLQDESHDKLLRSVIDEPMNLLKMVEESDGVLEPRKRERLIKALREARADYCSIDNAIALNLGDYDPDEYSGYKRLDLRKLYNLILFFSKTGVLKTKLNKLLFYADFKHYKEYGIPITGAQYAHIPFGPAPNNYEMYFASLHAQKAIVFLEEEYPNGYVGEIIKAAKEPDLTLFSIGELRVMASVAEDFANYSASQITDRSHREVGYQETKNGGLISYAYAAKLTY